jgi:hypothetical protein
VLRGMAHWRQAAYPTATYQLVDASTLARASPTGALGRSWMCVRPVSGKTAHYQVHTGATCQISRRVCRANFSPRSRCGWRAPVDSVRLSPQV